MIEVIDIEKLKMISSCNWIVLKNTQWSYEHKIGVYLPNQLDVRRTLGRAFSEANWRWLSAEISDGEAKFGICTHNLYHNWRGEQIMI